MKIPENLGNDNRSYLIQILLDWPDLKERIFRALLVDLHGREITSLDVIHQEARLQVRGETPADPEDLDDNSQTTSRWDAEEKEVIQTLVLDLAGASYSREEIDDIVNVVRKRVEARTLEEVANLSAVSFGLLAEKVRSFCSLPKGQTPLGKRESVATRVALIKRFISDQLEFIGIAKHYLHIRDFGDLLDRIIGSEEGAGLIGGKAGGMLLGTQILLKQEEMPPAARKVAIHTPESYYLRSDVMEEFLHHSGLQYLQDQKYKSLEEIRKDFPMIQGLLKNADLPPALVASLRAMLVRTGTHPLVVRSSSLLEDRFGTVFAGKYRSVFVANQGTIDERLAELLGAILEVYSSIYHPDPISYRTRHNLLDYDENMAVLIQKVVGRTVGKYFLPTWAGVGFSHNPYRRNPRIKSEDGLARIVYGLGTRAVDRVSSDFPRMIPLGIPTLRPEVNAQDIVRVSQSKVDVVDLEKGRFTTQPLARVLAETVHMPGMSQVFSTLEHGFLKPLTGDRLLTSENDLVVTFDQFAQSSPYPAFLRWCLGTLAEAYGYPVDIEFASDGEKFYLLQCRPQAIRKSETPVRIPGGISPERRIFSASRDILTAAVRGIEFLVLVDPSDYNALQSTDQRIRVARIIHRLNATLAGRKFILMGPGRWGSKDLKLGVRVGYADINNTAMLIEIARRQSGYLPDVSFGSHFFQDLAESDIQYLALYPEEDGAIFNREFLRGSRNILPDLLPELSELSHVVQVVDIASTSGGLLLNVDMDGDGQRALAYLAEPGN
jgi:pyruvate, water dikinase